MFYIEDDNFLQQPQKEHIDKLMSEIDFPVYFMDHGLTGDGNGQFVHSMLKRPEGCKPEERFNSLYFDFFMSCMITFLQKHNIEINKIVNSINHKETSVCVSVERSFLKELEGHSMKEIGEKFTEDKMKEIKLRESIRTEVRNKINELFKIK